MKFNLAAVEQEFRYTWPLVEAYDPAVLGTKPTFVFRRANRGRERDLLASISTYVTDERTRKTHQVVDLKKMDELYSECLLKIENLEVKQKDGDPAPEIDGSNKLSRLQNMLQSNLGLDVLIYGSLEEEMGTWFQKVILRRPDSDVEKNSKTPSSDDSAASK